jgi:hypothetical protein
LIPELTPKLNSTGGENKKKNILAHVRISIKKTVHGKNM